MDRLKNNNKLNNKDKRDKLLFIFSVLNEINKAIIATKEAETSITEIEEKNKNSPQEAYLATGPGLLPERASLNFLQNLKMYLENLSLQAKYPLKFL